MKIIKGSYRSSFSYNTIKEIAKLLKNLKTEDLKNLSIFLNITIENFASSFATANRPQIGEKTIVYIELVRYLEYGLNKIIIDKIKNWLSSNTPLISFSDYSRFLPRIKKQNQVRVSFDEIDLVKELKILSNDELNERKKCLDFKNGILYIKGDEVVIGKQQSTDENGLLEVIFRDKNKIWNNDEIMEAFEIPVDKMPKTAKSKKFYHIGRNINSKIAQNVGINKFLEITTKHIRINEKYL